MRTHTYIYIISFNNIYIIHIFIYDLFINIIHDYLGYLRGFHSCFYSSGSECLKLFHSKALPTSYLRCTVDCQNW